MIGNLVGYFVWRFTLGSVVGIGLGTIYVYWWQETFGVLLKL